MAAARNGEARVLAGLRALRGIEDDEELQDHYNEVVAGS